MTWHWTKQNRRQNLRAEAKADPAEESAPQSAVIRGQNDRAMHRVSRRSRRRQRWKSAWRKWFAGRELRFERKFAGRRRDDRIGRAESEPARETEVEEKRTEKARAAALALHL